MTIQELLSKQNKLFNSSISLIPSENYCFYEEYKQIFNSDINNRYSFFSNPTFTRAFPGHSYIQKIEEYVVQKLSHLFKATHINIAPLSGMNALEIFFMSMGKPGDNILIVSPRNGGHVSTVKIAENLGYKILYIPFSENNTLDCHALENICNSNDIAFIYIDQMNGINPISLTAIKHIDTVKYYDISHNAAFIASGHHMNPLDDGYNCFGGSTHKSFPGPQKAFFATNDKNIHNTIQTKTISSISNNHIGNIALLAISLEKMENHWKSYCETIIYNNRYFSKKLVEIGASIVGNNSNYSDNHQLFFYFQEDNQIIYKALEEIGIFLNLLPLPFTENHIIGFRAGIQEFTFLGGTTKELDIILSIIEEVVSGLINIEKSQDRILDLKQALLNKFTHLYD